MADKEWTADDVFKLLSNPVYIGLGEYPAIIDRNTFIKAGISGIKEMGAEVYLNALIDNLLEVFPPVRRI